MSAWMWFVVVPLGIILAGALRGIGQGLLLGLRARKKREVEDPWAVLYPPGPVDVERARQIARARGWLDEDGFIWDREETP